MENRINGDNKQQHNRNTLEELPSKKLNKKVDNNLEEIFSRIVDDQTSTTGSHTSLHTGKTKETKITKKS